MLATCGRCLAPGNAKRREHIRRDLWMPDVISFSVAVLEGHNEKGQASCVSSCQFLRVLPLPAVLAAILPHVAALSVLLVRLLGRAG